MHSIAGLPKPSIIIFMPNTRQSNLPYPTSVNVLASEVCERLPVLHSFIFRDCPYLLPELLHFLTHVFFGF